MMKNILDELDKIEKLLAILICKEKFVSLEDKIRFLKIADFNSYQIANILNKPIIIIKTLEKKLKKQKGDGE